MIREDEAHAAREVGLPPRERLQPGAEHDVLDNAAVDGPRQAVLGKPAPERHHGAEQARVQGAVLGDGGQDGRFRSFGNEADRHRISEDQRPIDELVRGAPDRGPQDGSAGRSGQHLSVARAYCVARPICRITGFHSSCSLRM